MRAKHVSSVEEINQCLGIVPLRLVHSVSTIRVVSNKLLAVLDKSRPQGFSPFEAPEGKIDENRFETPGSKVDGENGRFFFFFF